ncbi:hypothetical protein ACKZDW_24770 [Ralstonia syzygii subsp. celebesensis]
MGAAQQNVMNDAREQCGQAAKNGAMLAKMRVAGQPGGAAGPALWRMARPLDRPAALQYHRRFTTSVVVSSGRSTGGPSMQTRTARTRATSPVESIQTIFAENCKGLT